MKILKTLKVIGVLVALLMTIQIEGRGVVAFPDKSRVVMEHKAGDSVEYHYISLKTDEECGILQNYEYTGIFTYAYPTQWWNFTSFSSLYPTLEEAVQKMERYCPIK